MKKNFFDVNKPKVKVAKLEKHEDFTKKLPLIFLLFITTFLFGLQLLIS